MQRILAAGAEWSMGGAACLTDRVAPAVTDIIAPPMTDIVATLGGPTPREPARSQPWLIIDVSDRPELLRAYRALRRREFVEVQGLFARDDNDGHDADPQTRVLAALSTEGRMLGGVRIHPARDGSERIGWWQGSRLVVDAAAARDPQLSRGRIGAALVRAACAHALDAGALRFDAQVQDRQLGFFERLGWEAVRPVEVAGSPHRLMRWPITRFAELVNATKQPLAGLIGSLVPDDRWRGDDGVPVPGGAGVVTCLDAITPSMVQHDPEWAGWCGMLVTAHDLAAMGAAPTGALDALAAPDGDHARRVIDGVRAGADALSLPVLGGHTQLGVPAALSVTGVGLTLDPIPASGGRVGDAVTLTADVAGDWRPGYLGRQWDSSSWRTRDELAQMLSVVARARPHAAKDVSMAGVVGTLGMLAEASGCGAELDVGSIPRPSRTALSDWLTCFPGLAMVTCDQPGASFADPGAAVSATCGNLTATPGVRLRWPDGELTEALAGDVSGLGAAGRCEGGRASELENTTNEPEMSR
jgi:putative N-acetyltransferase (TIGR04045 family)